MTETIDPELARQFDRLPPADVAAERCLLGSVMLDPSLLDEVRAVIDRECFYQADHQIVWDVVCELKASGTPSDAVTIRAALQRKSLLEDIGGTPYLGAILSSVPSSAHAVHYAKIVREKANLRSAIAISNDLIRAAYSPADDITNADAICRRAADRLLAVSNAGDTAMTHSLADVMFEFVDELESPQSAVIPTGIAAIDDMIGGLLLGGVTVVAARPSMGKSTLGKEIIRRIAKRGEPVGIISVEEKRTKIAGNYVSNLTGIENKIIRKRCLSPGQTAQVYDAIPDLAKLPIELTDTSQRISDIEAAASRMVARRGVKAIMVDHLHLIDGSEYQSKNRTIEVGKLSTALKHMASRLNIALLELVQLNRETEHSGQSKRPTISMLRDSGTIEQDADTIILLYREDYYRQAEPGYQPNGKLEAIVGKQRDGECGIVPLKFEGRFQRISDWVDGPDYGGF